MQTKPTKPTKTKRQNNKQEQSNFTRHVKSVGKAQPQNQQSNSKLQHTKQQSTRTQHKASNDLQTQTK